MIKEPTLTRILRELLEQNKIAQQGASSYNPEQAVDKAIAQATEKIEEWARVYSCGCM